MLATAAVLAAPGETPRIGEVELAAPGPGEVRVAVAASGVCHSDVSVWDRTIAGRFPIVLGHEGAGVVAEVGADVTSVVPGDHVVLSWLAQCGVCHFCRHGQPAMCERAGFSFATNTLPDGSTRITWRDEPVYQMAGLGTFATHCVVPERSVVPVPADLPLDSAALLGCAVLTGWGAAANTATVEPGDSVVVIGCGGVGLNAVQGARHRGATTIVAVDPLAGRRELAEKFGATHVLAPDPGLVRTVRELTGGRGADVAIDVVGRAATIKQAMSMSRRGGEVVLVGAGGDDERFDVPAFSGIVMAGKTIRGSLYGSCEVRRDIPELVDRYRAGDLFLDELVTARFGLADIDEALTYCAEARGARAVITFR